MLASLRVRSLLLAMLFAPIAHTAFAQDKLDPKEFELGDWYTVPFEFRLKADPCPTKGDHYGYLVKATDDWIVLSCIRTEGRVRGVPWVSEIPYLGATFRTKIEFTSKVTAWIPRNGIAPTDRKHFAGQPDAKDFKNDDPKLEGECDVCYRDETGDSIASGKITAVTNDRLRILRRVRTRSPSDSKTVVKIVETEISFDKIVYVRQHLPVEVAKAEGQVTSK